jgi:ABC-2 type transport system ATP-binding protein
MTHAIQLSAVNKSFGPQRAVADLDLVVPRGALYGIIGPNGAGKSTSLRMMLSILFPDSGEISVLGARSALEAKDRIGYLPEERGVYRKMRVADFLLHMAILKGLPRAEARSRTKRWLERVGLPEVGGKRAEELSKGMQQKVQFIAAVIHEPELLILDEPFSGLDPVSARLLRELILAEHARGTTILFSTHAMHTAEQLCQHIVMIHRGRKVLDDPLASIRARHAPRSILFQPLDAGADVTALLGGLDGIAGIERSGADWRLSIAPEHAPGGVMQAVAAQLAPARIELVRPSLEDLFVEIAGAPVAIAEAAA